LTILFCDSSALVKLYVHEAGSDATGQHAAAADLLAVSRIAWVEALSAFARRARELPADSTGIDVARSRLAIDWPHYLVLELTQELAQLAGELAEAFALRAYDAVQLASVTALHRQAPGEVRFACHDSRLVKAAGVLGVAAAD
jgi:uncharacterized protein